MMDNLFEYKLKFNILKKIVKVTMVSSELAMKTIQQIDRNHQYR